MRAFVAIGLASALLGSAARAELPLVVDGQVGPAFLMRSRSKAIGHGFKPVARLGMRLEMTPRLELGGALSGIVDASEHYRVLGVLAQGRFSLWQRPAFSLGTQLGLGAGYGADILQGDLKADSPVVSYGFVALDARWSLGPRLLLGVETGWENLSILRLGLLVGYRLGGPSGLPVTR